MDKLCRNELLILAVVVVVAVVFLMRGSLMNMVCPNNETFQASNKAKKTVTVVKTPTSSSKPVTVIKNPSSKPVTVIKNPSSKPVTVIKNPSSKPVTVVKTTKR